jgi:protein TonB
MTDLEKLVACAAMSVAVHATIARTLEFLPEQPLARAPQRIEVHVVTPPPPEPPAIAPEPEQPKPEPKPEPKPVKPAPSQPPSTAPPTPAPPTPTPPVPNAPPSDEPVFGYSMDSTSQAGTGPSISVGNPGGTRTGGGGTPPPGDKTTTAGAPVPDYEVTTAPLPKGVCAGKYTDDARAAGIEGLVVLDLVVGEDGSVRDVQLTQKLGHGLDQAAVAALRACKFTPGEKDGKRVAVKIHGFKIRFVLSDSP